MTKKSTANEKPARSTSTRVGKPDADTPEITRAAIESGRFTVRYTPGNSAGKTPITIRLDEDIVEWFKEQGSGYQTRINEVLRQHMVSVESFESPSTAAQLDDVLQKLQSVRNNLTA